MRFTQPLCTLNQWLKPLSKNDYLHLPLIFLLVLLQLLFHLLSFFLVVELLLGGIHSCRRLLSQVRAAFLVSRPPLDVGSIEEPDVAVLVLEELRLHLQDLVLIHLLHVVSHLVALLQGEMLVVLLGPALKELDIVGHGLVGLMIVDLLRHLSLSLKRLCLLIAFDRSIELDEDGLPYGLGLDASLDAVEGEPLGVIGSAIELVDEFGILYYPHMLVVVLEGAHGVMVLRRGGSGYPFQFLLLWCLWGRREVIGKSRTRLFLVLVGCSLCLVHMNFLVVPKDHSISIVNVLFIIPTKRRLLLLLIGSRLRLQRLLLHHILDTFPIEKLRTRVCCEGE